VYVADYTNNCIQKFRVNFFKWGTRGSGNGQFIRPEGISVDRSTGNIFVADNGNNRIQEFANSGRFLLKFGSAGSADGYFDNPWGIAVYPNTGIVYVTDSRNFRVQVFG